MRVLTVGEFSNVIAVPQRTIARWVRDGLIRPVVRARGKGDRSLFGVVDVLAVALARDLRRRGFTLDESGAVLNAIQGVPLERLQAEWAGGKTHLLIIGERAFPWLLSVDSLPTAEIAAANAAGVRTASIDVAGAFAQLCAELDERARQPVEALPA